MGKFHDNRFPGESDEYRQARDELLQSEKGLRKLTEHVAALRRGLPLGGALGEDYVFAEGDADISDQDTVKLTRFSELFTEGKNSLVIYSFMYAPNSNNACPACTSILDSLNGIAPHVRDKINFVVAAKATIQEIRIWALERGWSNLRLLSCYENTYNSDYFAETKDGDQIPAINVFRKTDESIHHFGVQSYYIPPQKKANTHAMLIRSGHYGICLT